MRLKRAFFFIVFVAALASIILILSRPEPRYRGRSLTSWLTQCSDTSLDETQKLAEAQEAVRAMPVKRVLPRLLGLIETRDNRITPWVREQGDKHDWPLLRWRLAEDYQQLGIAGFEVLGTNAAPAAGRLTKLLDDPEHAFVAVRCLEYIGKAAEPAFCKGLTNADPEVQTRSINALASVTDTDEEYINRIKGCLNDADESVRIEAVSDIGLQTTAPKAAVPLLTTPLRDPSDRVNAAAASALAGFGTNALVAFEALKHLAENGGVNGARAALATLAVIAPARAVPILTNAVARGGTIAEAALIALVSVAPDTAAPILINVAQSPDSYLRQNAVSLLYSYPAKTHEIQAAIELAAADSDRAVALKAKMFLTGQYEQAHPHEIAFPDEPVYQGKTLGAWLDMHDRDGNYTREATNALRQMGTNAIPALLKRLVYRLPPVNLPVFETNLNAAGGFIMLGTNAIPAIPQLEHLMDVADKDIALLAMISTAGTGSNAMPVLMRGLTNRFDDVRGEAINYISGELSARYPEQRRAAIPILINLLQDTNEEMRMSAANAIKEIDPQTAARLGIK